MTETEENDKHIQALRDMAHAYAEGEAEVEPPYLTLTDGDCAFIWCPWTGALAVLRDDDADPVTIHLPGDRSWIERCETGTRLRVQEWWNRSDIQASALPTTDEWTNVEGVVRGTLIPEHPISMGVDLVRQHVSPPIELPEGVEVGPATIVELPEPVEVWPNTRIVFFPHEAESRYRNTRLILKKIEMLHETLLDETPCIDPAAGAVGKIEPFEVVNENVQISQLNRLVHKIDDLHRRIDEELRESKSVATDTDGNVFEFEHCDQELKEGEEDV